MCLQKKPSTYLFTGLPCSGKTTLTREIYLFLKRKIGEECVVWYDGDRFRDYLAKKGITVDFSPEGRKKNLNYLAKFSLKSNNEGKIVLASFISPTKETRKILKEILGARLKIIYLSCPLEECEKRDVKGMYARAKQGEIKSFTGISSSAPYEPPSNPHLIIQTFENSIKECVNQFLNSFNFF